MTELWLDALHAHLTRVLMRPDINGMIHAYMDRVSKSAKRIQADASTLPSISMLVTVFNCLCPCAVIAMRVMLLSQA